MNDGGMRSERIGGFLRPLAPVGSPNEARISLTQVVNNEPPAGTVAFLVGFVTDMKALIRFSRGQVRYTGRIARATFATWAESSEGRAALEPVASQMRFALFGKMRAARRRVWRQLAHAARAKAVVVDVQREVDRYLQRLDTIAYAHDLPLSAVHLRRLVVVPRVFVNADAYRRIDAALRAQPAFAAVDAVTSLRTWFVLTLIGNLEAAIAQARPSPQRPLPAGDSWIMVGVNEQFEWRSAIGGPVWPGHYYVLELRRIAITRAVRKAAREAVADLEASLPSLSRVHRSEILRSAASSLEHLARA
jgi:hypothetical protein